MSRVLFVCIQNAGRSQMAQALFDRAAAGAHEARSAGSRPAQHVHPEVVDAMRELGVDLSARVPHLLDRADAEWADVVVTMGCGDECPYVPGKRYIDWELDDPGGRPLPEVRRVRDDIAQRVDALVTELDRIGGHAMKYVLFVCTHNAGRSQMAQAFWRRNAPADVRAESAGQEPAAAPWPEVVEVMREVGIDIAHERPKKLDLEMQLHADWAITLGCGGSCPYVPTRVDDWDIPDPHGKSSPRCARSATSSSGAWSTSSPTGSMTCAATAPRTSCASSGCCPASTASSAPPIRPTKSAAARTPYWSNTTTPPSVRSSRRSPFARHASAYATTAARN